MFDDESECEHGSCKNLSTRCDSYWNWPDESDQLDCAPPTVEVTHCPPNERRCVQPEKNIIQCLLVERFKDAQMDCLSASDEVNLCRIPPTRRKRNRFHCRND